ncbi:MAG: hypothetical protein FWE09_07315, partial [Treponema sp.]|nr:hypothetical protein [Treponema sp.]
MRPKTLKKITPAAVFALAAFAALAALALASCGATAFERMQGRWNLAATSVGDESFRPGDEWRIGDYFLELMPDGTFRELGFWNEGVVVAGQWRASVFGLRLIPEEPADGNLPFAQRRAPKISEDGNSLTTRHRRR